MADEQPQPLSGPLFLAIGEDGSRAFSRDGNLWTNRQTGREGEVFAAAAFGGGLCVVGGRFGGDNSFVVTSDGVAWKASKHDAQYSRYIRSIHYIQGQFLGYGANFVMPSADGVKWEKERPITEYKVQYGIDSVLRRFAFGNDLIVAVGDFGRCATSRDGLEWKNAPTIKAVNTMIDVAYGNGVFVGGGMHGLRMRSVDGLTWTDRVVGEEGEHINAMIWDGRQFAGVGLGATYLSPDGLKWERVPNVSAPTAAVFGDGVYVGSLWPGRLLRSTDGIRWIEATQLPQHALTLAYGVLGKS